MRRSHYYDPNFPHDPCKFCGRSLTMGTCWTSDRDLSHGCRECIEAREAYEALA